MKVRSGPALVPVSSWAKNLRRPSHISERFSIENFSILYERFTSKETRASLVAAIGFWWFRRQLRNNIAKVNGFFDTMRTISIQHTCRYWPYRLC